jgi:NAD(P)-dependent dehydrogenase (short-subunit alcohol dehydrogenase family)
VSSFPIPEQDYLYTSQTQSTTLNMSQNPLAKKSSNGVDFTPTIRNDTYDFVKPEQWDLSSRSVLVTGASKGLGKDNAISFARAGASKIAIAARSGMEEVEKEMKAAAQRAGKKEPTVLSLKLDVMDKQSVSDAVAKIEKEFGGLDIVINNAGALEQFTPIADSDPDDWWRTWQVNTFGAYLVARGTIPLLLKKEGGLKTILNVSSIGAHFVMHGASAYQTSKLALIRFTEFVNAEYGEQGILSFAVHPGGVMTELSSGMPEASHHMLSDKPALAADTFVWLTAERRDWLASRYISCTWDMKEFSEMFGSICLRKKRNVVTP